LVWFFAFWTLSCVIAPLDELTTGVLLLRQALRTSACSVAGLALSDWKDLGESLGRIREIERKSVSRRRRSRRAQKAGKARRHSGHERELHVDAITTKISWPCWDGSEQTREIGGGEQRPARQLSVGGSRPSAGAQDALSAANVSVLFSFVILSCCVNIVVILRSPDRVVRRPARRPVAKEIISLRVRPLVRRQKARPVFQFRHSTFPSCDDLASWPTGLARTAQSAAKPTTPAAKSGGLPRRIGAD
jgi:hypothetical protein